MKRSFFRRYALPILIAAVCTVPLAVIGVRGALRDMNNNFREWLPKGFQESEDYDWFLENFGSEEMAVVSWPGCTLDDDRLERMSDALKRLPIPGGSDADSNQLLFKRIITPRQVLDQLTSPPLNLSRREVLSRLQGSLVGPDGKTCAMVVMVSKAAEKHRSAALEAIYSAAESEAGLARDELRLGGPTIDSVVLNDVSSISRYSLAGLAMLIALVLAWWCLKRPNLVVGVFLTALLCSAFSVAIVYFTGSRMNLVMTTMPTLIYVLAISGAIHLTNYYKDEVQTSGVQGAAERAVKTGWLPCSLTAATTALGLGSLAVSDVVPVKTFGIYSAVGVIASLPVLLLMLPAIWSLWPLKEKDAERNPEPGQTITIRKFQSAWSDRLAAFVLRTHAWILVCGLILMVLMVTGLFRLQTSVKVMEFFSPQSRIIHDYAWLEENIGPLVPIELVAHVDTDNPMTIADRAMLVQDIQAELESMDYVGGTMSVATFTPRVPTGGGTWSIINRHAMVEPLEAQRKRLIDTHYLKETPDGELWRVSARVEALNSLDYGDFISTLKTRVEPVVDRYRASYGGKISMTYTGIVPLVYKAQNELLSDLTHSFVTAFALIAIVMIVMLRSFLAGLLTMLPNVFPAVLIFGVMAWSGNLCDIGSMMTASVALGIAVDDTIHYLTWFNRGIQSGYSARRSVKMAHRHCAKAMLQTTLICGCGLLAFGLSSFVPTSRFATLMFAMLVAALIADLVLLPAILTGPLGRLFIKKRKQKRVAVPSRSAKESLAPTAQQSAA